MIDKVVRNVLFIIAVLFVFQTAARADDADDVNAIIKSLAPIAGQSVSTGSSPHRPQMLPDAFLPTMSMGRPIQIIIDRRPIVLDYRYSLDLTVYFAYDSAFLTPQARLQLSLLGRALQSPLLADHSYLLAGHTDSRGPDAYNMDLSYRRAWAVKRYLMRHFGIASWRLEVIGWGEDYLRDPAQPYEAVNRRVEITLIETSVGYMPPPDQPLPAPQMGNWVVPVLPACPSSVTAAIANPDLDLDDFTPEPWVDCDPSLPPRGSVIIQPDGRMIVQP